MFKQWYSHQANEWSVHLRVSYNSLTSNEPGDWQDKNPFTYNAMVYIITFFWSYLFITDHEYNILYFVFIADVKGIYEKATAPPVPSPPPTPQPKRTKADWERDQREVAQEMEGREALKKKKIPTYFDSEFGKAFLLTQAKDVDEILRQLSEDPRKDGTEAVRGQSSGQSGGPQISPVTSAYPARCKSLYIISFRWVSNHLKDFVMH